MNFFNIFINNGRICMGFKADRVEQELSHDSIARLNCALPIKITISVIR